MEIFGKLVLFILFLSFMVFVTFFGRIPALRNTPIASLYRLIWIRIPNAASAIDQRFTSGKVFKTLSWLNNRVMHERHPTVVIFFLLIMIVAEYMYLPQVWPQIGWFTKTTAAIVVFMPYLFLYLSCATDPGYITPQNHAYYMSLHPYDHALFHPGNECRTCRLLKPARSKHCDICKRCIAVADHHCVFINSCVGYGNHHWFLLLLFSTSILTLYGGLLGLSLLATRMKLFFPEWSLWPPKEMDIQRYLIIWGLGLHGNIRMGATTLLALLTTPLVWGLFLYSVYLVYCGTTTNESMKWSDYRDDMSDGYAFRRALTKDRRRNIHTEPLCSRWPLEPEHILLATDDGQPPGPDKPMPGDGEWERVWKLQNVENLYDMGLWDNVCDVFISDYTFGKARHNAANERRWHTKEVARSLGHSP